MKQSKKVVARIIILILALFTVIPGTVSQKVYAEPGGSESNQAADASKDDSNKKEEKKEEDMTPEEREKKAEEDAYKMEIQSNGWKNWPKGPGTYGEAAIVMDAGTGSILYAKNIDEHEYPASITKVLTSLIALKYGNLSDKVTFSNDCISFMQPGDSSVGLKEGNVISLEQALYATLLASANEAAYAVAENVGKNAGHDYNWFIQQMNEECKSLGGNNSNFVNANGLHDDNHYTCARDMALIGREIWRYPEFLKICQEQSYKIPASDTTEEHVFPQHHKMLIKENKNYYQYAVAGKTGYKDYSSLIRKKEGYPYLDIIVSGKYPPNPSELLASDRMAELLEECKKHYDYIIIDGTPLCVVSDALVLSPHIDGYILVAMAETSSKRMIKNAVSMVRKINGKVLGFVLTKKRVSGREKNLYGGYNTYYNTGY